MPGSVTIEPRQTGHPTVEPDRARTPNVQTFFSGLAICAVWCLTFWMTLPVRADGGQPNSFRVITYNVLVGFTTDHGEERKAGITDWLATQAPDVVAFQELNGYTESQLIAEAAAWGHNYGAITNNPYRIGLTSRSPIEVIEMQTEGMLHGLLHAKTAGIDFFVTHLSAFRYAHRQQEAQIILQKVSDVTNMGGHAIVLGDLNSLSQVDQDAGLIPSATLDFYRWVDSTNEYIENLHYDVNPEGELNFTVMQSFLDGPLIDPFVQHTSLEEYPYPRWGFGRIDYLLATSDLAAQSTAAEWVTEGMTTTLPNGTMVNLSDHFPMIVDFSAGDVNNDGDVDELDVPAFVAALTADGNEDVFSLVYPNGIQRAADTNWDGQINNLDIGPLINMLRESTTEAQNPAAGIVPEPGTLSLLALMALGLLRPAQRRAVRWPCGSDR